MGKNILVVGVSHPLASAIAKRLAAAPDVDTVYGIDVATPTPSAGVEFIRLDPRAPGLARRLRSHGIDTVIHAGMVPWLPGVASRTAIKEWNVLSSMQLFAACAKTETVQQVVMVSSDVFYGASAKDPGLFTEDTPAKKVPRHGWSGDVVESESYARGFARKRPDASLAIVRCAAVLPGNSRDAAHAPRSSLRAYLDLPSWPVPIGFNPRLQVTDLQDAISVVERVVERKADGIFTAAGDGAMPIGQIAALTRRPLLPMPFDAVAPALKRFAGRSWVDSSESFVRYLRYGRAISTTTTRQRLDLPPFRTTRDVVSTYLGGHEPGFPAATKAIYDAAAALRHYFVADVPREGTVPCHDHSTL